MEFEQQQITPIKIKLKSKKNNIKLYVLSDMHIGDANCDLNTIKSIIKFIKDTPECYCILLGDNSVGNSISIAYAKENQHLDAGAKMIHIGANTRSNIVSKSIADENGIANYRGKVKIAESAKNSYASIKCDTILLSDNAISDTYPINEVNNDSSKLEHEATVSKISEEKMFYLRSKGLTENQAKEMLIMGF